jgi:hypothetical protein
VLQDDGKAVVAGDVFNPFTGGDDFAVARYLVVDPDWIAGVVSDVPDSAFITIVGWNVKPFVVFILALTEQDIAAGDIDAALLKLQALRNFVDGCPFTPDANDWVLDCDAQLQVRVLIDQLIDKLNGA